MNHMEQTNHNGFNIRFWGVRGTIAVPSPDFMRYGGNTSCIEINCGHQTFILDAGTGIHTLGRTLKAGHVDLLLSHTHIDHICGLPFFSPMYDSNKSIHIWAGHLIPEHNLKQVFGYIMATPIFPITPEEFKADIHYHDFHAGEELATTRWKDAGIIVKTLPLNHPDRATGYRIEYAGKSLCYITDIEHTRGKPNQALIEFVRGATCLIYDSTYADENYEAHIGWGHSTWQEAVRIADAAQVELLVPFHHDPEADDHELDLRAQALEKARPGSRMAREHMELALHIKDIA